MLSSGLASMRRYKTVIEEQLSPLLISTEMTDDTLIHGGLDVFRATLNRVVKQTTGPVFVLTTCPAGVIGENVDMVIRAHDGAPGGPIIHIPSDGNLEGDYLQGVINACIEGAANLIDPHVTPEDISVNVVAEKNIALNADANFAEIERMLNALGLKVNCRFVRRTTSNRIREFLKASLNLPAYMDHLGRVLCDFFVDRFGCHFIDAPFPSGFSETERWLRLIATHFGRETQAESLLNRLREEYLSAVDDLRPFLKDKRLMLITYNHDVDWILETAFDLEMDIVKVGILDYSQDAVFRTRYTDQIHPEMGYPPERRAQDIESLRPDLFLGNYQSSGLPATTRYDTLPLCPNAGPFGGLAHASRWKRVLSTPITEGWRMDEARLLENRAFTTTGTGS